MLRLFLAVVVVLSLAAAGLPPLHEPSPAEAHRITCAKKRGKNKRQCAKRTLKHRRSHVRAKESGCNRRRPCPIATPAPSPTPEPVAAPMPASTATPTPTPTPTATPSATPTPISEPITTWRATGSLPLDDATAAARVRPTPENRPANAAANAYRPSAAELQFFRYGEKDGYGRTAVDYNRLAAYVTGNFSGTTDEILQWAAHKWGIPEDVVRAVAVNESWWRMSQLGDRRTVNNPSLYPEFSRIAGTSDVYESLGITQIKWQPNRLHPGTEPLRWKSTAFNVDYWGSQIRYYYDGLCDWCGSGYSAGQTWASIGAWFNPSPWNTSTTYVDHVKGHIANRTWARADF